MCLDTKRRTCSSDPSAPAGLVPQIGKGQPAILRFEIPYESGFYFCRYFVRGWFPAHDQITGSGKLPDVSSSPVSHRFSLTEAHIRQKSTSERRPSLGSSCLANVDDYRSVGPLTGKLVWRYSRIFAFEMAPSALV